MKLNKKLLAVMVAGTFTVGTAQAFHNTIPFDIDGALLATPTDDPRIFLNEIDFGGNPLDTVDSDTTTPGNPANGSGVLDLTADLTANAIPANTDVRVTIDLSNSATFNGTPVMADINDVATTPVAQSFPILSGGDNASQVIFTGNAGAGFAAMSTLSVDVPGLTFPDNGTVQVTVTVQSADNFGPTTLNSLGPLDYATFTDAVSGSTTATATPQNIDVTMNSLLFTGTSTSFDAGDLFLNFVNNYIGSDTVIVSDVDDVLGTVTFTLSAANGLNAFAQTGNGITITTGNGAQAFTVAMDTLTATATEAGDKSSTFNENTSANIAAGTGAVALPVALNVAAANTTTIDETALSIASSGAAMTGFTNTSSMISGDLASMARNGSAASLTMTLAPGGAFANLIRFQNPSAISGDVSMTVTDDDGVSATINLGDISGVGSSTLAAGAATGLISIDDIMTAAVAANSMLGAAMADSGGRARNKLSITANGAFGTTGSSTGIVINSFSVDTDGNGFSSLTNTNGFQP